MFHSFYLLVFLVTFSRNQNYISCTCKRASRFNGFTSISDGQNFFLMNSLNTLLHLADYFFRVFASWIIGSENHLVAFLTSDGSHHRTLERIAVASASNN